MHLPLKFNLSMSGALALTLAASVAFAQPPGGGGGRGEAMKAACGADVQKYCANLQPGPDLRACVRKNYASLSQSCKTVIEQMRARHQQQGGGAAS